MADDEVASPCIGVCRLDPGGSYCMGCFRTVEELTDWGAAPAARKREIVSRLPDRAARHRQHRTEQARAAVAGVEVGQGDRCVECGTPFRCGMNSASPCWCTNFPAVKPSAVLPPGCLCPDCLARTANLSGD